MSTGAGSRGTRSRSSSLEVLRARLYAPGATEADRAAYDAALNRTSLLRARRVEPALPDAEVASERDAAPSSPRVRPLTAAIAAAALVAVGAVLGIGAVSLGGRPSATPSASVGTGSPLVLVAPPLPTPISAHTLPLSRTIRDAAVARMTRIFASSSSGSALGPAVDAAREVFTDPLTTGDWLTRHGCSTSTGIVRTSPQGRPVVVLGRGVGISIPAQAHFRVTILMARPAGWSWVVSAQQGSTANATVAVGAGSPEAGTVQYAEFDATAIGDVTRLAVSTTGATPFLWQLESCVTGG